MLKTTAAGPRLFAQEGDGPEQELRAERDVDHAARAEYKITRPGLVTFTARVGNQPIAQQLIDARTVNLEQEYSGLNEALLLQLARDSGGQCLAAKDVGMIASFVKPQRETVEHRQDKPLWHNPWLYVLMLGCYGTELLLRWRYLIT